MEKQKFECPTFDPISNTWLLGEKILPIGTYTNLSAKIIKTDQVFDCCTINLGRDGYLGLILDTTFKTKDVVYDTDRISTNYESFIEAQKVLLLRKQNN